MPENYQDQRAWPAKRLRQQLNIELQRQSKYEHENPTGFGYDWRWNQAVTNSSAIKEELKRRKVNGWEKL